MGSSFYLPGRPIIADVTPHSNGVYVTGRPEWPVLLISLEFDFNTDMAEGRGLDINELRGRLSPGSQGYIAWAFPVLFQQRLIANRKVAKRVIGLEVPVDRHRLAAINRLRNGGDVQLKLDLELSIDELQHINLRDSRSPSGLWALGERYRVCADLHLSVPRSVWVERILSAAEFTKSHIIELPAVPIERIAELKAAFEALQQAQVFESQGHYREAIAKCRIAIEPFLESVQGKDTKGNLIMVPQLKSKWQTKLGQATYDWINSTLGIIKQPMNSASHVTSKTFGQLECQMILAITTALVAYAAETTRE